MHGQAVDVEEHQAEQALLPIGTGPLTAEDGVHLVRVVQLADVSLARRHRGRQARNARWRRAGSINAVTRRLLG
ncbi:MAG: hypothetical protein QM770_20675 [Tepidisphaeraceae bacterium]